MLHASVNTGFLWLVPNVQHRAAQPVFMCRTGGILSMEDHQIIKIRNCDSGPLCVLCLGNATLAVRLSKTLAIHFAE